MKIDGHLHIHCEVKIPNNTSTLKLKADVKKKKALVTFNPLGNNVDDEEQKR